LPRTDEHAARTSNAYCDRIRRSTARGLVFVGIDVAAKIRDAIETKRE
jgi:hypothetical protein